MVEHKIRRAAVNVSVPVATLVHGVRWTLTNAPLLALASMEYAPTLLVLVATHAFVSTAMKALLVVTMWTIVSRINAKTELRVWTG